MRKLSIFLALGATVLFTGTGCLKDKGYDAQEYGLQIQEKKAVAFPEAASSPITVGINSQSTPLSVDGPSITLEHPGVASSDVHITIQIKNTLVTDLGMTPLPAGSYTVTPMSVTIPAGSKLSAPIKVNIANSSLLNPTTSYGVGLTISAADGGYIIAANQRDIVVAFNIKNQFDGKYRLKGQFYHPTSAPTYPWYTTDLIEMQTSGPNSVKMYCLIPGITGFYHPWSTGTGLTAFAGQEPEYTINIATNAVTVQNVAPGAATFYEMAKGFNNAGYNSRRDPATKTIYANFGYNLGAGQTFVAATTRMWVDTLIYLGPR